MRSSDESIRTILVFYGPTYPGHPLRTIWFTIPHFAEMISFALSIVFCHPYASAQLCEPDMHIRPKPGKAGNRARIALEKSQLVGPHTDQLAIPREFQLDRHFISHLQLSIQLQVLVLRHALPPFLISTSNKMVRAHSLLPAKRTTAATFTRI